ncbi:MAG: hypothetical protein HLUCCX10_15570 [Algoriphagus marincola HL-49]|uniref:Uncharacterized protein n=1 Tax=Algoriphagus marincola HL-49 TaxID=1305737 RepID=A0A0N8KEA6_9BACT|nr:MAG: hypothetical protein HLUCCX10_15570 [Algoriphagus marincola HL-49]
MKITFIIGPSGVGKSSFISQEYAGRAEYCIFNIAQKAKELFGSFSALDDEDKEIETLNEVSQDAFFALMDGKELVVEYLADGFDDGLFTLCKKAKLLGIRTEIITLTTDEKLAWERVKHAGADYFPSVEIKEETEMVLMNILEDVEFNLDFVRICEVGAEGGSINFYRFRKDGIVRFFFTTIEEGFFDFKPDFAFEELEGVNYLEEFEDFPSAFQRLFEKYPVFRLYPLEVHADYKNEFREAYQHFLETEAEEENQSAWNIILN